MKPMSERRLVWLSLRVDDLLGLLLQSGMLTNIAIAGVPDPLPLPADARVVAAELSCPLLLGDARLCLALESDLLPPAYDFRGCARFAPFAVEPFTPSPSDRPPR